MAESAAAFITRKVRAGDDRRFSFQPVGTAALMAASRIGENSRPIAALWTAPGGVAHVAAYINSKVQGSARRPNLCDRKCQRMRFRGVNRAGVLACT